MKPIGRTTLCALFLALAARSASAECVAAPDLADYQQITPEDIAAGPTRLDRLGRVVAPISVNGQGPFRFIVDTGANRSVVSQGLAERIGLFPIGTGEVHSVYGVSSAPMVNVDALQYGALRLGGASLPMLQGAILAGEHGLLGVDGMQGRRLLMDFERNCIEIVSSAGARPLGGWTRVRGEMRFGHLVVIRGTVGRIPVNMFVDTGSNFTMANIALQNRLRERVNARRWRSDPVRAFTAGEPIVLDTALILPRVDLGAIEASNIIAYVGDFHIFRLWNFIDEPALLIGMDVLSQTRGIAIDYERATVHFRLLPQPSSASRLGGQSSPSQRFTTSRGR